jgi:hypothetical protein
MFKDIYEKYALQNWHDVEQNNVMNLIYNFSQRSYIWKFKKISIFTLKIICLCGCMQMKT